MYLLLCPGFRRIALVLLLSFPNDLRGQVGYPHPFGAHSCHFYADRGYFHFRMFIFGLTCCYLYYFLHVLLAYRLYEYLWSRSTYLNHGYCGFSHTQLCVTYASIRGLCGSKVHNSALCRSSMALPSRHTYVSKSRSHSKYSTALFHCPLSP